MGQGGARPPAWRSRGPDRRACGTGFQTCSNETLASLLRMLEVGGVLGTGDRQYYLKRHPLPQLVASESLTARFGQKWMAN